MKLHLGLVLAIVLASIAGASYAVWSIQSTIVVTDGGLYKTPLVDVGTLPDARKTPGVTNPNVTQANIKQTICVSGWTATIRPPASYTTKLKVSQLNSGYAFNGDMNTASYEEDHLISLELGGNPTDPKNLWPELYTTTPNAKNKDKTENYLKAQVCSGAMTLVAAQKAISTNWIAVYNSMGKFGSINDETDQDDI